nr:MAG TPA: YopX protein [Caudoviricetes sp.]
MSYIPKFKAISKETGKWICGNYIQDYDLTKNSKAIDIIRYTKKDKSGAIIFVDEEVESRTICMELLTTAKNGNYAYENDIILFDSIEEIGNTEPHMGLIQRVVSEFEVKDLNTGHFYPLTYFVDNYMIVGNLYNKLDIGDTMEIFNTNTKEGADRFYQFMMEYKKWNDEVLF